MTQTQKIATINLYGEDGIAVYLTDLYDLCGRDEAAIRVIGHRIYASSMEEAEQSIRAAYLKHIHVTDPIATTWA
jgi:hypothetical protein